MKTFIRFVSKICPIIFNIFFFPVVAHAQWSAPVNISPNAVSAGLNESMGTCIGVSGDTLHVIWSDKFSTKKAVIYYTRSIDSGLTWSNAIPISDINKNALNPAIAVNGPNVHAVWRYIDTLTNKRSSHYIHSIDGGNTWGTELLLDTAIADWPAVAVSGNIVYVANDYVTAASPYNTEIFFLRSIDNGNTWSPHQQISFAVNRSEDEAITAQGSHVHMSWNDKRTGKFQIFYKESADYGVTWGPDIVVDTAYDYSTMVSVDGQHIDVIAAGHPVSHHYQLLLAQSSDTGSTWANTIDLTNDTTHTYFYPDMVRSGSDLHIVCGSSIGAKYLHSADGGATWDAPYTFTGSSTFVAYTGCIVHIIYVDATHHINYLRNPTGNSGHCAIITGTAENSLQETISVYPNPFTNQTTIKFFSNENIENASLKIFDLLGNEIKNISGITNNEIKIERGNLTPGIYFYQLKDNINSISIGKLIVQ